MPDIDDLFDDSANDSDLVKTLRSALKAANKEKQEAATRLAALEKGQRTNTLADVFKGKGLSPKAAALYPADADASPEAVDAWLGEFGELFGIEQRDASVDEATREAAAKVTSISGNAPPSTSSFDVDALAAAIAAATTPTEYEAALKSAGMTLEG